MSDQNNDQTDQIDQWFRATDQIPWRVMEAKEVDTDTNVNPFASEGGD